MRHGDLDTVRLPPRQTQRQSRPVWLLRGVLAASLALLMASVALVPRAPSPDPAPAPHLASISVPALPAAPPTAPVDPALPQQPALAPSVQQVSQPSSPRPAAPPAPPVQPTPLLQPVPPPSVQPISQTPSPLPGATGPRASEADILDLASNVTETRRFVSEPDIEVLTFATLADQAQMLNRIAGLVERAGFPHDRVLSEIETDERIRAGGDEPNALYNGHDYRSADVMRFFEVAKASGQALTPGEQALLAMVSAWGWQSGKPGALISLVGGTGRGGLDHAARSTILRHELSHGMYFVNAAYAAYARQFWDNTLTASERGHFVKFLGSEGYDTSVEDLMINETQAYLMHTADKRFFNAAAVGLRPERLNLLRGLFLTGMPPSWLRDCTTVPPRAQ